MRKLWEADNEVKDWDSIGQSITQEDYNALVSRLNELADEYEKSVIDFETYKNEVSNAFTTTTLKCTQLTSQDIDADNIEAEIADITHLTVNDIISSQSITTPLATIDSIIAAVIRSSTIEATSSITSPNIQADNAEITNLTTENLTITGEQSINNADITTLTVQDTTITQANIQTADITNLDAFDASFTNVSADDIDTDSLTSDIATIDTLTTTAIQRNKFINITSDWDDCIVALPFFINGSYRLISYDNDNTPQWEITVYNEENNFRVHWSQRLYGTKQLEDMYIWDTSGNNSRLYFKIHVRGRAQRVYYQVVSANEVTNPAPMTFETYEDAGVVTDATGAWHYNFVHLNGNFFQRQLDQVSNEGEHPYAVLQLFNEDDLGQSTDYLAYDGLNDVEFHIYRPDQSLNTTDDVVHKGVDTDRLVANKRLFVGSLSEYNKSLEETPLVAII